jgi:hypothetical protein
MWLVQAVVQLPRLPSKSASNTPAFCHWRIHGLFEEFLHLDPTDSAVPAAHRAEEHPWFFRRLSASRKIPDALLDISRDVAAYMHWQGNFQS